ncbi:hypothetical protein RRG08_037801 [Elysia crispata]|uniref:Uncharacterized protein n=1 Tax=Elysia crispata TaxID=231223 RepID=A0AAE1EF84_9GAST|nr:hypothetical protein RRG08_037801 [Elysia crispata]
MLESLLVTPGSLIYYNLRCYTGTSTGHTRLIIILLTHIILESLLVTTERLPYFTITRTRNGVKALYKSDPRGDGIQIIVEVRPVEIKPQRLCVLNSAESKLTMNQADNKDGACGIALLHQPLVLLARTPWV